MHLFLNQINQKVILSFQYKLVLCTLKIARRIFPGLTSYKLSSLSETFFDMSEMGDASWHRSDFDTTMTVRIFKHIYEESCKLLNREIDDPIDFFTKLSNISIANVKKFIDGYN
jgi:DNA polymerase III subunit epsilon